MASSDDLAKQLKIIQQMNAVMQQIAGNQKVIEQAISGQAGYAQRLVQLLQQMQGLDLDEKFKTLGSTLAAAAEKAGEFDDDPLRRLTKSAAGASDQFETLAQKLSGAGRKAGLMGVVMDGLRKGFSNFVGLSKSTLGFLGGIVEWAGSVAAAIVSIPLRILEGLINLAASSNLGLSELRREIEAVRKQFGDLKGPGSAAILVATKTLQGFHDTGLRAWRVFGTLAERLAHFRELATSMGATFSVLTKEFEQNGGALAAYQKGLGADGEAMKGLASRSIVYGRTIGKTLNDIAKQSLALGKQFDLDQKLIARDMAKASIDVRHFGTTTVKEIGVAATYARKLGVELDKITGTLDAFETFDTAAENAAKLSQAFGVQVDAFKLMESQNPAEQIDMLRKQFRAAGVDASQFNRQQLRLLSSTTGLDEATAQQVFSQKNFGVSLDDVRKRSETAEKQQLTQAEAMSKLADSIERMVKDGPVLQGSFFRMFIDGFLRGIQVTKEFRTLMLNIRESLRTVMRFGVQFGRSFVANFDGVRDALKGLSDMFAPKNFSRVAQQSFAAFNQLLKGGIDFSGFMDQVMRAFGGFTDAERGPLGRAVDGFKRFFIKLADIAGDGIKWAGDKIGKFLETVADYISGKKKLGNIDLTEGDQFLLRVFKPIFEGFESAWTSIKPPALRMLLALGDKLLDLLKSPEVQALGARIAPYVAAIIVGPAVVNAIVYTGTSMLLRGIGTLLTSRALLGGISASFSSVFSTLASVGSTMASKLLTAFTAGFGPVAMVAAAGAIGYAVGTMLNDYLGLDKIISEFVSKYTDKGKAVAASRTKLEVPQGAIGYAHGYYELNGKLLGGDGDKQTEERLRQMIAARARNKEKKEGELAAQAQNPAGPHVIEVPQIRIEASAKKRDLAAAYDPAMADIGVKLKRQAEQLKIAQAALSDIRTVEPQLTAAVSTGAIERAFGAVTSVAAGAKRLDELFGGSGAELGTVVGQLPKIASSISKGAVQTALTAVKDVVAMVQELDDALSKTPRVDIATRLSALAQGSGLGSKANYTVSSKAVNIYLNLEVTMDAGELEKVVIMRKESIIRDRLEFATIKAPGQQGNNSLPEKYTANVPNIVKR